MASLRKARTLVQEWEEPEVGPCRYELEIDEARVQHFRNVNRLVGDPNGGAVPYEAEFMSFWAWYGGVPELDRLRDILRDLYITAHGRVPQLDRHYADFLKRAVKMPYQFDDRSIGHIEYAKFPIEVLYDKEGDCECLSLLLCAVFARAGFQTALLLGFTEPRRKGGHAATGIILPPEEGDDILRVDGDEWIYCEAVSDDAVGRCGFSFALFAEYARVIPLGRGPAWDGRPPRWICEECGPVEPWVHECACGVVPTLSALQQAGEAASDWEEVLVGFVRWLEQMREASPPVLLAEIEALRRLPLWNSLPGGNRRYLEEVLDTTGERGLDRAIPHLDGAREHMLAALPHAAASIFCSAPGSGEGAPFGIARVGMSVYAMSNATLEAFARKVLADTTCKRIAGFSGGSRLAIGRILDQYRKQGDAYMDEKRASIENILVKVVIPQAFSLLAREHFSG